MCQIRSELCLHPLLYDAEEEVGDEDAEKADDKILG
jgi:hypothetical protein